MVVLICSWYIILVKYEFANAYDMIYFRVSEIVYVLPTIVGFIFKQNKILIEREQKKFH